MMQSLRHKLFGALCAALTCYMWGWMWGWSLFDPNLSNSLFLTQTLSGMIGLCEPPAWKNGAKRWVHDGSVGLLLSRRA